MKQIVVGFDGSPQACDALRLGDYLAEVLGARLNIAFIDVHEPGIQMSVGALEISEELYERVFEQAAEELGNDNFERHGVLGSVALGLEVVARDTHAELIVVGSTHRGKVGQVVPGSVGDRLLSGSPCGIAVAPRGYTRATRSDVVGVGYDGEPEAEEALKLAEDLARASGASLRMIAAAPPIETLEPGRIAHTAPGYARRVQDHLRRRLVEAGQRLDPEIQHALAFEEGDAAEVLCAESETLDLLVLGSRGYGPIRRVLLGGTASKVMRAASCAVIVVPRSATEPRHRWLRTKPSEPATA
jgi:nucleotide-binding universal stress UspA family protein